MQTVIEWLNWLLPWIGYVLGALVLAWVGTLSYNIYFAKHEETIRVWLSRTTETTGGWLSKTIGGWLRRRLRRRYVRYFVEAVQGETNVERSNTNAYIFMVASLVLVIYGVQGSLIPTYDKVSTKELFEMFRETSKSNTESLAKPPIDTDETHKIAIHDIGGGMRAIIYAGPLTTFQKWLGYAMLTCGLVSGIWMLGFRLPYLRFRSRFAYELERFTLRIQGLATKDELAELIQKEMAVRDEKTAEEFVEVMAKG